MAAESDEFWMAQALRLARKGYYSTHPNPRVGCLVVKDSKPIAEGWHEFSGGPHAEVNAINSGRIPEGADFFVTLEPCSHQGKTPPCADALIKLKPRRVIIAMQDPNPRISGAGIARLEAAGIEVVLGVLQAEARSLNRGFISRMEKQRPLVRLKMAMSLDGRTALRNGKSKWISGEQSRLDVQRLRAASSAILSSAKTVRNDDPSLNLRLSGADLGQSCDLRHPVRVIIDSSLSLTGKEKLFNTEGAIWIYTLNSKPFAIERLMAAGAQVTIMEETISGNINLSKLLAHLAIREINEVHTECGQTLAGALIQQRLVDELIVYLAPKLLGSRAQGAFDLGEITQISEGASCKIEQLRNIGDDIRLTLSLNPRS